ncbi:MAG: hypothetical protein RLZZ282_564 [Verrucomicrobiota bacterium]
MEPHHRLMPDSPQQLVRKTRLRRLSGSTPAWTRTKDQLIKSQLLYQLSYRGIGWNQTGYCSVTRCK